MTTQFIHKIFSKFDCQADDIALIWTGGHWTYGALKAHISSRIQSWKNMGLEAGDRTAICLPKGPVAVEILLAGFASGIIPVPIDYSLPPQRVAAILDEIDASLFLTTNERDAEMQSVRMKSSCKVEIVDPHVSKSSNAKQNLEVEEISEDQTALILMTSGSTGIPKGILLSLDNISAFSEWAIAQFNLSPEDRFISIAPFHFDLSMLDIYASLSVGASVFLPSETELIMPGEMARIFNDQRITVLYAVPTFLQILMRYRVFQASDGGHLRQILFAGEIFPAGDLSRLMKNLPDVNFANLFGPTETNVISFHELDEAPTIDADIPIGVPCAHTQIEIRSCEGTVFGANEVGEIYAKGRTVMLGYWGRGKVARDQFFGTGDRGFWDDQGLLHYCGRDDHMIKIRGMRSSLEDIAAIALKAEEVGQAVAHLMDRGTLSAYICLDVVAYAPERFDMVALKAYLVGNLHKHFLPKHIKLHDKFPVTANGKTDRQGLQEMWKTG